MFLLSNFSSKVIYYFQDLSTVNLVFTKKNPLNNEVISIKGKNYFPPYKYEQSGIKIGIICDWNYLRLELFATGIVCD